MIRKTVLQDYDTTYANPFVGPIDHTTHVTVDISELTSAEVDADGYLKPGVPLKPDGTLADGTAGERAYLTVEAAKVHTSNSGLASVTADVPVAVATVCQLNQAIGEDILGRAYTANEIAALRNGAIVVA